MQLTMKGVNIDSLAAIREYFAPDILGLKRVGELSLWLREKGLPTHATAIDAIPRSVSDDALLSAMCEIFDVPLSSDVRSIFLFFDALYTKQGYRPPLCDLDADIDMASLKL